MLFMIIRRQIVYDEKSDKFKHLKKDENRFFPRVDINELNKRLNQTKRLNFYNTTLIAILCLSSLILLGLVSVYF